MRLSGRGFKTRYSANYDVVVVGSGPGGAAVAARLAAAGVKVAVVEEGEWFTPADFSVDAATGFAEMYRDMGMSTMLGSVPMPYLQGRAVGGTSVVNGAISWRLPKDVYEDWVRADPALAEALPWKIIEAKLDAVEARLRIAPTPEDVAQSKNLLMAKGAEALGLAHRPISRNVQGCDATGRCLQGCPKGAKQSMDRTYLLDAEQHGAHIISGVRVERIERFGDRARGISGRTVFGNVKVSLGATTAVVLAASAIQTPALLLQSGISHGPVGRHLQCHPGVAMSAYFDEPVRMWKGATQGHEVIGLRHEGIKFEVLGFGMAILASRIPGVGQSLMQGFEQMAHYLNWGAAIKAEGRGRVRRILGKTVVQWSPTSSDIIRFRRGLQVLGQMLLAAGARRVVPDVYGWDAEVTAPERLQHLVDEGPHSPKAYHAAVTHMFSSCRMDSHPARGVVRPDFRHHHVDGLYLSDSSVFPSNTGVNPQTSILALAGICADNIVHG